MNKTDKIDLGVVQIHKKVLADIVAAALADMDGVRLMPQNALGQMMEGLGYKNFPGIEVNIEDNDEVVLHLKVLVRFGINIPDISRQIQSKIQSVVKKIADVNLKGINVNVVGIERGMP